jgi:hypothetical protein
MPLPIGRAVSVWLYLRRIYSKPGRRSTTKLMMLPAATRVVPCLAMDTPGLDHEAWFAAHPPAIMKEAAPAAGNAVARANSTDNVQISQSSRPLVLLTIAANIFGGPCTVAVGGG